MERFLPITLVLNVLNESRMLRLLCNARVLKIDAEERIERFPIALSLSTRNVFADRLPPIEETF